MTTLGYLVECGPVGAVRLHCGRRAPRHIEPGGPSVEVGVLICASDDCERGAFDADDADGPRKGWAGLCRRCARGGKR